MRMVSLALAALSIATPASAATLITENFETSLGVFSTSGQAGINTGAAYVSCCGMSGSAGAQANHFVAFGSGDVVSGTLSTTFNTVAGGAYSLSFDYGVVGSGQDALNLLLNGVIVLTLTPTATGNLDTTFANYPAYAFLGTGSPMTLAFRSAGAISADAVVDNVQLTGPTAAGGVPEPATWAMMLLGFGAIGVAVRRRRSRRLAAA